MKKALLVLFTVLMLFAFVSCDKDKSDEMAHTFVDFSDTFGDVFLLGRLFREGEVDLSTEEYDATAENKNTLTLIVEDLLWSEGNKGTLLKVEQKEGTAVVKEEYDKETNTRKFSVSAKGIIVSISYSDDEGNTKVAKFSMSGSSEHTIVEKNEKEAVYSFSVTSAVLNGRTYKDVTATVFMSSQGSKFTAATCDGKDVNLDILNAANLLQRN